jgi:cob(I)alamin adenosyltransferase
MNENKVYTKTGDDGFTSLISGKRVPKHDKRIKAYGAIDELIAWLGLVRDTTSFEDIKKTLTKIQKQLMVVAAELAIDNEKSFPSNLKPLDNENIIFIENEIDQLTARLSPLRNFVIPGGHYPNFVFSYCKMYLQKSRKKYDRTESRNQNFTFTYSLYKSFIRLPFYSF